MDSLPQQPARKREQAEITNRVPFVVAIFHDSLAFRFICANQHPDHDSINAFRKRFRNVIGGIFVQILLIAKEAG